MLQRTKLLINIGISKTLMLKKSLSYVMLLKVTGNFVADKDLICHLSYKVNLTS